MSDTIGDQQSLFSSKALNPECNDEDNETLSSETTSAAASSELMIDDISECKSEFQYPYNAYEFAPMPEFHRYNEIYFNVKSDTQVFFKIESDSGTYYCKTLYIPHLFENNDDLLIVKFCDLMEKFKALRFMKGDQKIDGIKELGLLIGCPEYNICYKSIKKDPNPSRIRIYYIALITQIKKQVRTVSSTKKSDRLLNQMLDNTPCAMARTVSCNVSTQYSTSYSQPIQEHLNEEYDSSLDICIICSCDKRSIVNDCGHCIKCVNCTKQLFFKIDPNVEINTQPRTIVDEPENVSPTQIEPDVHPLPPLYRAQTNYQDYSDRNCPVCRKKVDTIRKTKQ